MSAMAYRTIEIDGVEVFYREAGQRGAPSLLLLHGFPSSSHLFRQLMPLLADRYHLIAPDLPGFGRSAMPPRNGEPYRFESLQAVLESFVLMLMPAAFSLYVVGCGATLGLTIAQRHPQCIHAVISQNGNVYEEGLSGAWNSIRNYGKEPTASQREALRARLQPEAVRWYYTHGVLSESAISPDAYTLDSYYLARPGVDELQLDLFLDEHRNIASFAHIQAYLRQHQPPLLAIWGKNDPFLLPAGARAFSRDLPQAQIQLLDTGHFALETHSAEIAKAVRQFLG